MARGTGVFMPRCYSELSATAQGSNTTPAVGPATAELRDDNPLSAYIATAPEQRNSSAGSAAAQSDTPYHKQISSSIKAPARAFSNQVDHQPAQSRAGITVRRVPWQQQPQAHSSSMPTNSWPGVQCMAHPPPPPPPPPPPSALAPAGGSPSYRSINKIGSSSSSLGAAGVASNSSPVRPGTHPHLVGAGHIPQSSARDLSQGQARLSSTESFNSSAYASSLNRVSVSSWDGLDSPCNAASAADLAALGAGVPAASAAAAGGWGLQHQDSLDPNFMFGAGSFQSCPMLTQLLQGASAATDKAAATPAAAAAAADGLISSPGGCFNHSNMSHSWAEQGRFLGASNSFTGRQLALAHEPVSAHSNSRLGSVLGSNGNLIMGSSLPTVSYLSAPLPSVNTQLVNSSSSNLLFQPQAHEVHPAGTSPVPDSLELLRQQLAAAHTSAHTGAVVSAAYTGAHTGAVMVSAAPPMGIHRQSSFGSMSAGLLGTSFDEFASAVMLPGSSSVLWGSDLTLPQHLQLTDATLGLPNGAGGGQRSYQRSLSGSCGIPSGSTASAVPSGGLNVGSMPSALHSSASHVSAGLQALPMQMDSASMQMLAPSQQHNSVGATCVGGGSSGEGGDLMAVAQMKLQQLMAVEQMKLQQLMAVEQMQQQLQDEVMRLLPLI